MTGEILGIHHVKIPVTDLPRSRTWYERVFDLEPRLEWPDDDGAIRGVSYRPKGGVTIALRENEVAATAVAGFDPLAILVASRADLQTWTDRLDELGIEHSRILEGAVGWLVTLLDPDGIELKLYTAERRT